MEATLSVPLKEQEHLQELFRLLEENGLVEEKKQVAELADYIDTMENQFGKVLEELTAVKEQLGKIQDSGIKASAIRVVGRVEGKLRQAKGQLDSLKYKFMQDVSRAVEGCKEKGTRALAKAVDTVGIQKGLVKLKEQLAQSVVMLNKGFDRLGDIADEMHAAKIHLGNIGREITGKEPVKESARDVEKGMVYQIQKIFYQTSGVLRGMEKRTDHSIQKLERFAEYTGREKRPSIRESLKSIQEDTQAGGKERKEIKEKSEGTISFFAAECMEFLNYGELRENLTLPEAVSAYREIRKRGESSGPGIGFVLHDKKIPDYSNVQWPLYQGRGIAREEIQMIPAYRDHPLVKQAVKEIERFLPKLKKNERQKHTAQR